MIFNGYSVDIQWIFNDIQWIFSGYSMIFNGYSMDIQ